MLRTCESTSHDAVVVFESYSVTVDCPLCAALKSAARLQEAESDLKNTKGRVIDLEDEVDEKDGKISELEETVNALQEKLDSLRAERPS